MMLIWSCSQPDPDVIITPSAPPSTTPDIVSIKARANLVWTLQCAPAAGTRHAIMNPTPFDSAVSSTQLANGYPVCFMDGRLLLIRDKHIACHNALTGDELWRFDIGTTSVDIVSADKSILVYGSEDDTGYLKVLDADGTLKGDIRRLPVNARTVVEGNTIFVGTANSLIAFDIESLEKLWDITFTGILVPYRKMERWSASPACAYVEVRDEASKLETLLAYDARTGRVMWTKLGTVRYADEHRAFIYKKQMNKLFVRKNTTGELIMSVSLRPFDGRFLYVTPTRLVFTSNKRYYDGDYLDIDIETTPGVETTVSLVRELLCTDFNLTHVKWHISLGSAPHSDIYALIISDEAIVLGRGLIHVAHGFYALSDIFVHCPNDASLLWKTTIPQGWTNISLWKKMLFVRSYTGMLYAFSWNPHTKHEVDLEVESQPEE